MFEKYFTPQEANKTLPLVKEIVLDIVQKGRFLNTLLEEHDGDVLPEHCYELKVQIEELVVELQSLGCFYKDWNFEIGLVDFPSKIDGEDVFLCWKSDEKEIKFYHLISEEFPQRKKIPRNLLKDNG